MRAGSIVVVAMSGTPAPRRPTGRDIRIGETVILQTDRAATAELRASTTAEGAHGANRPHAQARRRAPGQAGIEGRPRRLSTPSQTYGHDKAAAVAAEADLEATPDLAPGAPLGGGEASRPHRPPGDRRGRQGRHDPQGHGRLQPTGLHGHRVQGPDPDRARPTTTCGGSIRTPPRRARSRSSTVPTTRTSWSSGSTTSSRRRSGGSATTTSTTGSGC